MKITFYDTKSYDRESFEAAAAQYPEIEIEYMEADLSPRTARYAQGSEAACIFVNSDAGEESLAALREAGVRLLLLRCAGFNQVDLDAAARLDITVLRVPGYSPEAVAEHAMALALAVNRHIHKAYIKVRENNFSLVGLTGENFYRKTAGIIGTGKIGAAMCRICRGFGMRVIAYDKYENPSLPFVEYVPLDTLYAESDLISLHCPLTDDTRHMIDRASIARMKDGVLLVNTSRGGLVDTEDLIAGIRSRKIGGVGLDVYEEEGENVFENRENEILAHSVTARLLSHPNVIITSHQGFLTQEALEAIAQTTLKNARDYLAGTPDESCVVTSPKQPIPN